MESSSRDSDDQAPVLPTLSDTDIADEESDEDDEYIEFEQYEDVDEDSGDEEGEEDDDDGDGDEDEQDFLAQLLNQHVDDDEDLDVDLETIGIRIEGEDGLDPERIAIRRREIIRLLQNSEIGRLLLFNGTTHVTHARSARQPPKFPDVPSIKGEELMSSGGFGANDFGKAFGSHQSPTGKAKKLARRLLDRELAAGTFSQQHLNQKLMAQGMIPSSTADMIVHYDDRVYSGQFSDDGNFFFSANKDFKVRMYDTSNPYEWRYYKTVRFPRHLGQWTLTDASLSPDNKYLAYTSIQSTVCLAPTDPNDLGDPYNLDLAGPQDQHGGWFGIWSVRFSGDGRRLVAGATEGKIVVYDIESRTILHSFDGHEADVNAVCFADSSSPHIVYSGSDDNILKVWDTRSMGGDREVGAFIGHIEGLTYIDSKGDGRYILSNGKDQSMKLWDLRMVKSRQDVKNMRPDVRSGRSHFDYRQGNYDDYHWYTDRNDNSLVTYRGHRVLRTLIRCHFSPPGSSNSRYVYSGSADGKVYVWNMDATLAGKIDVQAATMNSQPSHGAMLPWQTCVRDASWHPSAPMVVASAWNGYGMEGGSCTVHSWNDGAEDDEGTPGMGWRVNERLEVEKEVPFEVRSARMVRTRRFLG